MRKYLIFFTFWLAAFGQAYAQSQSFVKEKTELLGCWRNINFPAELNLKFNPEWKGDFPVLVINCFFEDGKFAVLEGTAEANLGNYSELEKTLRSSSTSTFEMLKPGLIVISFDSEKKNTQGWSGWFMTNRAVVNGVEIPNGALVMGLFDMTKGRQVLWRYFKKIL